MNRLIEDNDDLLGALNKSQFELQNDPQANLIQSLIDEILRVKSLIKRSQVALNDVGEPEPNILTELLTEAYHALINYDTVLMQKYYDLLLNCD